jgi:hypothetical protein
MFNLTTLPNFTEPSRTSSSWASTPVSRRRAGWRAPSAPSLVNEPSMTLLRALAT